jgi:hypothetical protein
MSECLPLDYQDYLAFPRAHPDGLVVQQAAAQITDKLRVQQLVGQITNEQMVQEVLSRIPFLQLRLKANLTT